MNFQVPDRDPTVPFSIHNEQKYDRDRYLTNAYCRCFKFVEPKGYEVGTAPAKQRRRKEYT